MRKKSRLKELIEIFIELSLTTTFFIAELILISFIVLKSGKVIVKCLNMTLDWNFWGAFDFTIIMILLEIIYANIYEMKKRNIEK